jgi:hypothetical protein
MGQALLGLQLLWLCCNHGQQDVLLQEVLCLPGLTAPAAAKIFKQKEAVATMLWDCSGLYGWTAVSKQHRHELP